MSFILHEINSINKEVGICYGGKYNAIRKMESSQNFSVLDSVTSVELTGKVKFEKIKYLRELAIQMFERRESHAE